MFLIFLGACLPLSFINIPFFFQYRFQSCGFDGVVDWEFFVGFLRFLVSLFLDAASLLGFNPWDLVVNRI